MGLGEIDAWCCEDKMLDLVSRFRICLWGGRLRCVYRAITALSMKRQGKEDRRRVVRTTSRKHHPELRPDTGARHPTVSSTEVELRVMASYRTEP